MLAACCSPGCPAGASFSVTSTQPTPLQTCMPPAPCAVVCAPASHAYVRQSTQVNRAESTNHQQHSSICSLGEACLVAADDLVHATAALLPLHTLQRCCFCVLCAGRVEMPVLQGAELQRAGRYLSQILAPHLLQWLRQQEQEVSSGFGRKVPL